MAPATNEEQFKFLISCIRYSNNGKVEFGEVAKECNIVSKGAAAKRYERMMKAHGIAPNAATVKTPATTRILKTERWNSKPSPGSKRAKLDHFSSDASNTDDDEIFSNANGNTSLKSEAGDSAEHFIVKEDPDGQQTDSTNSGVLAYLPGMNVTQNNNSVYTANGFGGDDGFGSGGSMYEPSSNGYNTPVDSKYGLRTHSRSFLQYNECSGESDSTEPQTPASQIEEYNPSRSIVIPD